MAKKNPFAIPVAVYKKRAGAPAPRPVLQPSLGDAVRAGGLPFSPQSTGLRLRPFRNLN